MSKRIDLTGRTFGKLTVVSYAGSWEDGGSTKAHWNTGCACGGTRVVSSADLRGGKVTQCRACTAQAAEERRRETGRRFKARLEERQQRQPLTTEQRRNKALAAYMSNTGEGQKYVNNFEAYRAGFTSSQRELYFAILRGRSGRLIEAEAVDRVMRETADPTGLEAVAPAELLRDERLARRSAA